MTDSVYDTIDRRFDSYVNNLERLLSQPSVSATGEGIEECVEVLGELLETYGFEDYEEIGTSRYPLVYAERIVDESAPTVVFYGHYDVQPPGDEDLWDSPAFEPTIRDGAIYARGSGDNKGQLMTHLFALDALAAEDVELDVNVKVLIEGGEESSSIGLIEYLEGNPEELQDADLVYVSDGPLHESARPTLIYGNRGILSVEVTHQTANQDLHSGNFGGPIPNAPNELVETLATMFEGDQVTIDGFHDDIAVTEAQRALLDDIPFDEAATKDKTGLDRFATEKPFYERMLLEPTMTINGIFGGYTGEGTKTIIPHRATAKLDFRLVPEQDPDTIFELVRDHVHEIRPEMSVEKMGSFPPMQTPVDTPAATIIKRALQDAWENEPVEMPLMGGSLPAAYFRQRLDVPVLVVPYANPDQANHSPNEHLELDCLKNGIRTSAKFLQLFEDEQVTL